MVNNAPGTEMLMEATKYPGPQNDFTVFVRTITFNQAKYITDNLNGVAMQQTDFPFVHFVIDDASTDGEQEVILDWLAEHCDMGNAEYFDIPLSKIILVNHKTNANCSYAIYLLKQNLYKKGEEKVKMYQPWRQHSKYEALCEGDDYWTIPNKLQVQVDYLESHPDITLSCCRYMIDDTFEGEIFLAENAAFDLLGLEDCYIFDREDALTGEWITKTLTCVYRQGCYKPDIFSQYKYFRDVHMVYYALSSGKGVCHSFVGGVYRKHSGGIFGSVDRLAQGRINYAVFREFASKEKDPLLSSKAKEFYISLIGGHVLPFPHNFRELGYYCEVLLDKARRIAKLFNDSIHKK